MIHLAFWLQLCLATVFGPADLDPVNSQDTLACPQPTKRGGRRMRAIRADDVLVALPRLPCGTRVLVCVVSSGRCVQAFVADRGPHHGGIDLSIGAARRLGWPGPGFSGRELVLVMAQPQGAALPGGRQPPAPLVER